MIAQFLDFLIGGVFDFLGGFFGLFPQMPDMTTGIRDMLGLELVSEVFGWVNYFLPLDIASSIVGLWSVAIMAYVGLKLAIKYAGDLV